MEMSSSQDPRGWFHKRQRAGFSKDSKTGMVLRSFAEPFGGAIFISRKGFGGSIWLRPACLKITVSLKWESNLEIRGK